MIKKTKFNFLILISVLLILSGCKSGKPDMAYEQEDGGAVQGIGSFDVTSTAENFRETSDQFAEDAKKIKEKNDANKATPRRVSLNHNAGEDKTPLIIIDHNEYVKKLETKKVSLKFKRFN